MEAHRVCLTTAQLDVLIESLKGVRSLEKRKLLQYLQSFRNSAVNEGDVQNSYSLEYDLDEIPF